MSDATLASVRWHVPRAVTYIYHELPQHTYCTQVDRRSNGRRAMQCSNRSIPQPPKMGDSLGHAGRGAPDGEAHTVCRTSIRVRGENVGKGHRGDPLDPVCVANNPLGESGRGLHLDERSLFPRGRRRCASVLQSRLRESTESRENRAIPWHTMQVPMLDGEDEQRGRKK